MLTAKDKIRREIIETVYGFMNEDDKTKIPQDLPSLPLETAEKIEEAWSLLDYVDDAKIEARYELRRNYDFETNEINTPYSRHYESKAVAKKMSDGSWVGWTYWYGGGKHGDPDSIDWIAEAYNLDCVETQEMVTVRKWSKRG